MSTYSTLFWGQTVALGIRVEKNSEYKWYERVKSRFKLQTATMTLFSVLDFYTSKSSKASGYVLIFGIYLSLCV